MHGGRKLEIQICGVKSSGRPRYTRGCSIKDEEADDTGFCTYHRTTHNSISDQHL